MASGKIVENCLKSVQHAKNLRNLNVFAKETFDTAIVQSELAAERIETQKAPKSKLDGRLFSIKDNFCTKSVTTTCGSKMLEDFVPPFDATVYERLVRSGAISLGKTNMDEFGMGSSSTSCFGTVKNPWNIPKGKLEKPTSPNDFYISGGSSGGSAAAVASGICEFSIGSDTGGSVRNPSSICGCIGYKPTYGLISRYGLIPLNNYFDTVGIMARSVETIVQVLNEIAGPDPRDATTIKNEFKRIDLDKSPKSFERIRFGIPQEFYPAGMAENNLDAWNESIDIISKLANYSPKMLPLEMPHTPFTMSCYSVLTSCEVASNFARYDGLRFGYHSKQEEQQSPATTYDLDSVFRKNRDESLGKVVKGRIVSGNYFLLQRNYEKYFDKSQQIKQLIVNDFQKSFAQVDILVTPTCFHDTPTYEEYLRRQEEDSSAVFDEKDFFTACANIAGVPAISIPVKLSKNRGLPIGIQLMANWNNDALLLNVARSFSAYVQEHGFPFLNDLKSFEFKN